MDEYRKAAQEMFLLNKLTYFAFVVSQISVDLGLPFAN